MDTVYPPSPLPFLLCACVHQYSLLTNCVVRVCGAGTVERLDTCADVITQINPNGAHLLSTTFVGMMFYEDLELDNTNIFYVDAHQHSSVP